MDARNLPDKQVGCQTKIIKKGIEIPEAQIQITGLTPFS
jgi:hypothetical protein